MGLSDCVVAQRGPVDTVISIVRTEIRRLFRRYPWMLARPGDLPSLRYGHGFAIPTQSLQVTGKGVVGLAFLSTGTDRTDWGLPTGACR